MPETGIDVRCAAVGTIVVDASGAAPQLLLVRRATGPLRGLWSLVTGWIEQGETAAQAARREVMEETGIVEARWYAAGYTDRFYNVRADRIELVPLFVAWCVAAPTVRLNDENTAFCWTGADTADRMIPFHGHREAVAEVARSFFADGAPDWLALPTDRDG